MEALLPVVAMLLQFSPEEVKFLFLLIVMLFGPGISKRNVVMS